MVLHLYCNNPTIVLQLSINVPPVVQQSFWNCSTIVNVYLYSDIMNIFLFYNLSIWLSTILEGISEKCYSFFLQFGIFYRMGTDNFYYICLKTYISSNKMSTETLLRSEYNRNYEFSTFKTRISKYTEYLLLSDQIRH